MYGGTCTKLLSFDNSYYKPKVLSIQEKKKKRKTDANTNTKANCSNNNNSSGANNVA
jgi:hypothetical protein